MKNTSQIFYKYAHINIAVSPEDNSSYLLITRFDLIRKPAKSLQILGTLVIWWFISKIVIPIETLFEGGSYWYIHEKAS